MKTPLVLAKALRPMHASILVALVMAARADAQFSTNDYFAVRTLRSGSAPISVQTADLTGDGLPDAAVANYGAKTVSLFQNLGAGDRTSLTNPPVATLKLPGSAFRILLADLDGDHRIDLLAAMHNQGRLLFFKNIHPGGLLSSNSFASPIEFSAPGTSGFLGAGDFDGDGLVDLAVGDSDISKSVQVLHQRPRSVPGGAVAFDPIISLPTGAGPADPVLADLDGDGRPDLIAPDGHGSSIAVFQNLSKPGLWDASAFGPLISLPSGVWPQTVAVGDIDGDGKPDIASVNSSPQNITLYRNLGPINGRLTVASFAAGDPITKEHNSYAIQLVDLDRDGKPDLVVCDGPGHTVRLYRNRAVQGLVGAGSFAPPVNLNTQGNAVALAMADFRNSGQLDYLTTDFGGDSLCLVESTAAYRPRLGYSRFEGALLLRWDTNAADFLPQKATASPSGPWLPVSAKPIQLGGENVITLPTAGAAGYFRLARP